MSPLAGNDLPLLPLSPDHVSSVKGSVRRMKRQATGREKTFTSSISDEGLLSGIHKAFSKLNSRKQSKSKMGNDRKRIHQRGYADGK